MLSRTLVLLLFLAFEHVLASGWKRPSIKTMFKRVPNRKQYPELHKFGPKPLDAWVKVYQSAKKAGVIAKAPLEVLQTDGSYDYPAGTKTGPKGICWSMQGCFADDVRSGPAGHIGISFDDGPREAMKDLNLFLRRRNQTVTHFMCGQNIVELPELFLAAVNDGNEIAVHTWAHPHMPSLTDEAILGELGWTMQIIYDKSGIMPAFWRPPFGDADNRVRSIAKNVFGLTLIQWKCATFFHAFKLEYQSSVERSEDTHDWCLRDDGTSACDVPKNQAQLVQILREFVDEPKSQSLIILEHVTSFPAVKAFMQAFPTMRRKGWVTQRKLFGPLARERVLNRSLAAIGQMINRSWNQL